MVTSDRKPKWQKVLYLKQPYPDNYVPDTFLDCLVTNASVPIRRRPFSHLVFFSFPIILRFSCLALWLTVYFTLASSRIPVPTSLDPPFRCPHVTATYPFLGEAGYSPLVDVMCAIVDEVKLASPQIVFYTMLSFSCILLLARSLLLLLAPSPSPSLPSLSPHALMTATRSTLRGAWIAISQVPSFFTRARISSLPLHFLVFLALAYVLSPMLSSGARWALVAFSCLLHVIAHDYRDLFGRPTSRTRYVHLHTHLRRERALRRLMAAEVAARLGHTSAKAVFGRVGTPSAGDTSLSHVGAAATACLSPVDAARASCSAPAASSSPAGPYPSASEPTTAASDSLLHYLPAPARPKPSLLSTFTCSPLSMRVLIFASALLAPTLAPHAQPAFILAATALYVSPLALMRAAGYAHLCAAQRERDCKLLHAPHCPCAKVPSMLAWLLELRGALVRACGAVTEQCSRVPGVRAGVQVLVACVHTVRGSVVAQWRMVWGAACTWVQHTMINMQSNHYAHRQSHAGEHVSPANTTSASLTSRVSSSDGRLSPFETADTAAAFAPGSPAAIAGVLTSAPANTAAGTLSPAHVYTPSSAPYGGAAARASPVSGASALGVAASAADSEALFPLLWAAAQPARAYNKQLVSPLSARILRLHTLFTVYMFACAWIGITAHSPVMGYALLLCCAGTSIAGPALYLALKRRKRELAGPWDYDDEGEKGRNNI